MAKKFQVQSTETISVNSLKVVRPGFYAERFQDFLKNKVFIPQSKSSLPNPSQILEQGLEEELEDKL